MLSSCQFPGPSAGHLVEASTHVDTERDARVLRGRQGPGLRVKAKTCSAPQCVFVDNNRGFHSLTQLAPNHLPYLCVKQIH